MLLNPSLRLWGLILPALAVFSAFFLLPMTRLAWVSAQGPEGFGIYLAFIKNSRYFLTLVNTVVLSLLVTLVTLVIASVCGLFLTRRDFRGKKLMVSLLTFPLAFPGVVVGFMIILLVGRQGMLGQFSKALGGDNLVLAYSMGGLFLGYLYFSIPRVILTVMAAAEKIDIQLEEAARSLGAGTWPLIKDIIVPA
ncbi:MAG: ABC transporter permease subunit, partial [Desulfarculaceae bacterium]